MLCQDAVHSWASDIGALTSTGDSNATNDSDIRREFAIILSLVVVRDELESVGVHAKMMMVRTRPVAIHLEHLPP